MKGAASSNACRHLFQFPQSNASSHHWFKSMPKSALGRHGQSSIGRLHGVNCYFFCFKARSKIPHQIHFMHSFVLLEKNYGNASVIIVSIFNLPIMASGTEIWVPVLPYCLSIRLLLQGFANHDDCLALSSHASKNIGCDFWHRPWKHTRTDEFPKTFCWSTSVMCPASNFYTTYLIISDGTVIMFNLGLPMVVQSGTRFLITFYHFLSHWFCLDFKDNFPLPSFRSHNL